MRLLGTFGIVLIAACGGQLDVGKDQGLRGADAEGGSDVSDTTGGVPGLGGWHGTGGTNSSGDTSVGGDMGVGGAPTVGPGCLGKPGCPWSELAPLPEPSRSLVAVTYQGLIYTIGGTTPNVDPPLIGEDSPQKFTDVLAYDPETDIWSKRAPLPVGTLSLGAHVIGDKIYAFAGYGADGFVNEVEAYDPATDSWELKAPRPTYRYTFGSEVIANRVVLIGGFGPVDNMQAMGQDWEPKLDVEVYDVAEDTWTTMSPAPRAISDAASCVFGDQIYLFGGEFTNRTSVYDVTQDRWSEGSRPPIAREGHACVRVGDRFLLLGGRTSGGPPLDAVEQYDPVTDTWTHLEALPEPRVWLAATSLGSSVYVIGGESDNGVTDSVLRLDVP